MKRMSTLAMAVPIQYDKMAMSDTYLLQQTSANLIKKVNGNPELVGLYSQLLADVDRQIDAIRRGVTHVEDLDEAVNNKGAPKKKRNMPTVDFYAKKTRRKYSATTQN